ncbi:hypothetical protein Q8F55_008207 [Vanrija albida]|uniref:Uncharacterized protein n=1 Tax=Vanrija albida TaxID=181172 RepID=A0ABR3PWL9_9TREE
MPRNEPSLRPRRSMLQLFANLLDERPRGRSRSRSNPPQMATEVPPSRPGTARPPSYASVSSIPPYTPFVGVEGPRAPRRSAAEKERRAVEPPEEDAYAPHELEGGPYPAHAHRPPTHRPPAHRRSQSTHAGQQARGQYDDAVEAHDPVETLFTPVKGGGAEVRSGGPRYPAPSGPLPPVPSTPSTPRLRRSHTVQTPRTRANSEATPRHSVATPRPAPTPAQHAYDPHKRQVVLLVNDGTAMAPYWARLLTELGEAVAAAEGCWHLGIDVFFVNSANYGRGLTREKEVVKVFEGVRPTGGPVTPEILRRRIVKMVSSYGPSWSQVGDDGMRVLKLLLYVGDWCYTSDRPVTLLKRLQRSHTNSLVSNLSNLERYLE